jgi:dTDP-4-dehydrorhamnose reductase
VIKARLERVVKRLFVSSLGIIVSVIAKTKQDRNSTEKRLKMKVNGFGMLMNLAAVCAVSQFGESKNLTLW